MVKVFLDTNVFVRFLSESDPLKLDECKRLFSQISQGRIVPYSSGLVFLETFYVLTSVYKFSKSEVVKDIKKLFRLRNLTIIEKINTRKGFEFFEKYKIKLADCIIATQIPKKVVLCTYDDEFGKLKFLKIATPEGIIRQIEN